MTDKELFTIHYTVRGVGVSNMQSFTVEGEGFYDEEQARHRYRELIDEHAREHIYFVGKNENAYVAWINGERGAPNAKISDAAAHMIIGRLIDAVSEAAQEGEGVSMVDALKRVGPDVLKEVL